MSAQRQVLSTWPLGLKHLVACFVRALLQAKPDLPNGIMLVGEALGERLPGLGMNRRIVQQLGAFRVILIVPRVPVWVKLAPEAGNGARLSLQQLASPLPGGR